MDRKERLEQQLKELEEEWTRLDNTEFTSTPQAMTYYTQRVNSLMKEIAELKERISSASNQHN